MTLQPDLMPDQSKKMCGYLNYSDRPKLFNQDPSFWNPDNFSGVWWKCLACLVNTSGSELTNVNAVAGSKGKFLNKLHGDSVPEPFILSEKLPAGTKPRPSDIVTPSGEIMRQAGLMTPVGFFYMEYECHEQTLFSGAYAYGHGAISFKLSSFADQPDITVGFAHEFDWDDTRTAVKIEQTADTKAVADGMTTPGHGIGAPMHSNAKLDIGKGWCVNVKFNSFAPWNMLVIEAGP